MANNNTGTKRKTEPALRFSNATDAVSRTLDANRHLDLDSDADRDELLRQLAEALLEAAS